MQNKREGSLLFRCMQLLDKSEAEWLLVYTT